MRFIRFGNTPKSGCKLNRRRKRGRRRRYRLESLEGRCLLAGLTVSIAADEIAENAGLQATTVLISRGAGNTSQPLDVSLTRDTTEVALPQQVTIPANEESVTLDVAAVDDFLQDGTQQVQITAAAAGYTDGMDTVAVTDHETLDIRFSNATVGENAGDVVASVSRSNSADASSPLVVALASDDPAAASVPASVTIPAGPTVPDPTSLFVDDFETGGIAEGWSFSLLPGDAAPETSDNLAIVSDPVNTGNSALEVIVRPGDAAVDLDATFGRDRAEIGRVGEGDEGTEGTEQWFAFSIMIPADDLYVGRPGDFLIMAQWKYALDGISPAELQQGLGTPPIALLYEADGLGESGFSIWYGVGSEKRMLETSIDKGVWIDMVFHIGWSRDEDGFLEVWKDGEAVSTADGSATRLSGANRVYNNDEPSEFKLGLYRGHSQTVTTSVYYDSVSIGNEAPGASSSFIVSVTDNDILNETETVDITASASGYDDAVRTLTITDYEALTVSIAADSIAEEDGQGATTATITRSNTDNDAPLVVTLSSDQPDVVAVPATVTIPANQPSATIDLEAIDDTVVDGDYIVVIQADAEGYVSGTDSVEVVDSERVELYVNGTLGIRGSERDDVATISFPNATDVEVVLNTGASTTVQTFDRAAVSRIIFLGGEGNDFLDNQTDILTGAMGQGGDDELRGGSANDFLFGGFGNDLLVGGAGIDLMRGDEDDDTLFGDEGNDLLYGSEGNDLVEGGAGLDQLEGGDGDDTLRGGPDDDVLRGGDGDDILEGDDNDDQLYGGSGNDTLRGNAGRDTLFGNAGQDSLFGGSDVDDLAGNEGADFLDGGSGDDQIDGGPDDDMLFGGDGNDSLSGAEGADELDGGDGEDFVVGGIGNDTLRGGLADDTLQGGDGDDFLQGDAGNDTLQGDNGNDELDGGSGADGLFGELGDDILRGGDGNDDLQGGSGNDTLEGGAGVDELTGGDGDDLLRGGDGDDEVYGGADNDILLGDDGDDLVIGFSERDLLIGGRGLDSLQGSDGDDIVIGATTDHDLDDAALREIMDTWTSAASYTARVDAIEQSISAILDSAQTVHDDLDVDRLTGGADDDWFLVPGDPADPLAVINVDIVLDFQSSSEEINTTILQIGSARFGHSQASGSLTPSGTQRHSGAGTTPVLRGFGVDVTHQPPRDQDDSAGGLAKWFVLTTARDDTQWEPLLTELLVQAEGPANVLPIGIG